MIKECPVIINNNAVTVVRFGDTDVQFPSIMSDTKTVNVKYESGEFFIVDHASDPEQTIVEEQINKEAKKTIKKKNVKVG